MGRGPEAEYISLGMRLGAGIWSGNEAMLMDLGMRLGTWDFD